MYLALFIALTQRFILRISEWWLSFFKTNTGNDSVDLPLPQQTPARPITFQARMSNSMRKTPHVLLRISSSYFQSVKTPITSVKGRTLSLKCEFDDTCVEHKRTFSNPLNIETFSPMAKNSIDKLCEMCCERLCNAVIMDCGHGGICYECSLEMWKTVGFCHMCRGEIKTVLQIEKCKDQLVQVHSTTRAVYCEQEYK